MTDFYKDLFHEDVVFGSWNNTTYTLGELIDENKLLLDSDVNEEEVKDAMLHMGSWKSPGPDGFSLGFYQNSWHVVWELVCDFVARIWNSSMDIAAINKTNICLILKIEKPEFVTQFRPISLCNKVYKVVSKVTVNRLKEHMNLLISLFQTGFIFGRNIHENVIVA